MACVSGCIVLCRDSHGVAQAPVVTRPMARQLPNEIELDN